MRTRLLLGPVLLAALFAVFWADERFAVPHAATWMEWFRRPGFALLLAGLVLAPMAAWELKQLFRALGFRVSRTLLLVGAVVGMVVPWVLPDTLRPLTAFAITGTAAAGVLITAMVWHSRTRSPKGVSVAAGAALLSFVYLGIMFGFVLVLRREHSAWVVLWVLVITKSCDIGAYFTGTLIGRHKLILWLSPGKTWEGLAGGIFVATLLGVAFAWWATREGFAPGAAGHGTMAWWDGAALGALLAITGQTGDLVASLLKRDAGVKDSGSTVPGFGGILDVVDSVIPAAPVAYWLLHRV